jgi:hypothetical protein
VRANIEGNRKGIPILTMSTKPTLSFFLLITLTLLSSKLLSNPFYFSAIVSTGKLP